MSAELAAAWQAGLTPRGQGVRLAEVMATAPDAEFLKQFRAELTDLCALWDALDYPPPICRLFAMEFEGGAIFHRLALRQDRIVHQQAGAA
ncbi:hypothetical protein AA13595_0060 [Gluconacetobacter johannae DSM 13595]|uniref:Uncharacterized protein n=1 Tax=Gluconacetobacter johannae TaxID=112140 RepID=A0A7W4J8N4_9PROT|nr:hypothetical protein [Gluconacetobacter johannae]MBB2176737.1 hypothetical protein [Gluconacetobacter johannae]GBQ79559.1 hypothetical protein AA13595_0060 [Gluconacetobacter johannae DSM 13595]